jgi:hypothetical protein
MPEAIDTVWRLGASCKRECYRSGQTDNELPSPHVRTRLIDDRVAQAPEGVKGSFSAEIPRLVDVGAHEQY